MAFHIQLLLGDRYDLVTLRYEGENSAPPFPLDCPFFQSRFPLEDQYLLCRVVSSPALMCGISPWFSTSVTAIFFFVFFSIYATRPSVVWLVSTFPFWWCCGLLQQVPYLLSLLLTFVLPWHLLLIRLQFLLPFPMRMSTLFLSLRHLFCHPPVLVKSLLVPPSLSAGTRASTIRCFEWVSSPYHSSVGAFRPSGATPFAVLASGVRSVSPVRSAPRAIGFQARAGGALSSIGVFVPSTDVVLPPVAAESVVAPGRSDTSSGRVRRSSSAPPSCVRLDPSSSSAASAVPVGSRASSSTVDSTIMEGLVTIRLSASSIGSTPALVASFLVLVLLLLLLLGQRLLPRVLLRVVLPVLPLLFLILLLLLLVICLVFLAHQSRTHLVVDCVTSVSENNPTVGLHDFCGALRRWAFVSYF